jgi:hypothetical protein
MTDLSPIIQPLEACVLATVLGAIPLFGAWMKSHLNFIQSDALKTALGAAIDDVDNAATQAAGEAYHWVQGHDEDIRHPMVKSAVADRMLATMAQLAGPAIAASGVTPQMLATKADAALGKLLASDPTVSVTGGGAVPPTTTTQTVADAAGATTVATVQQSGPATLAAKDTLQMQGLVLPPPLVAPPAPAPVSNTGTPPSGTPGNPVSVP